MKLICHIRDSRSKAKEAAGMEVVSLLRTYHVQQSNKGPMSDQAGIFWAELAEDWLPSAAAKFPLLGYTTAIDVLAPSPTGSARHRDILRYQGKAWQIRNLYREDEDQLRSEAPDKREFLLPDADGSTRNVRGYRGSDTPGERRGLPACDARLLVNLVTPHDQEGRFLDPFAGAGSIVQHALHSGLSVYSNDIDEKLAEGLTFLGSKHHVSDARTLPFDNSSFDAIATELPFDRHHGRIAIMSLNELHRLLVPGGRLAILCARWQTRDLLTLAKELHLTNLLSCPIDRKALKCSVLSWEK